MEQSRIMMVLGFILLLLLWSNTRADAACVTSADCGLPDLPTTTVSCLGGECWTCTLGSSGFTTVAFNDSIANTIFCPTACSGPGTVGDSECKTKLSDTEAACFSTSFGGYKTPKVQYKLGNGSSGVFGGGCFLCLNNSVVNSDGTGCTCKPPYVPNEAGDACEISDLFPPLAPPTPTPAPSPPDGSPTPIEGQRGTCRGDNTDLCKVPKNGSVTCFRDICSYCPISEGMLQAPYPTTSYSCGIPCEEPGATESTAFCNSIGATTHSFCSPLPQWAYPYSYATLKMFNGTYYEFRGFCSICKDGFEVNANKTGCVDQGLAPPPNVSTPPVPPPASPPPKDSTLPPITGQRGSCPGDNVDLCAAPTSGSVTCYNNRCSYCPKSATGSYQAPYSSTDSYECGTPCAKPGDPASTAFCDASGSGDSFCSALFGGYAFSNATFRTETGIEQTFQGFCAVCRNEFVVSPDKMGCVKPNSNLPPVFSPPFAGPPPKSAAAQRPQAKKTTFFTLYLTILGALAATFIGYTS